MPQHQVSNRQTANDTLRLKRAFLAVASFVALLWAIKIAEGMFDWRLGVSLGIYPLTASGLIGVALAPLIHGSSSHLLANTAPVLVLGTVLLFGYPRAARRLLPAIYLGTGLAVWLFGRPSYHFGASGLTFGTMFFVFTVGILRWDRQAIALAMIVSFLYGSTIWGIFPGEPSISFETHFFAALIGVTLAITLRNLDPPRPPQRFSWEDEEEATTEGDTTERFPAG